MILVLCETCALGIRVMGGDPEEADTLVGPSSEFWPDEFPCPECERHAKGYLEVDVDPQVCLITRIVNLTPQEAYAAFNGFGLPNETNCTKEVLTALLKEQPVKRVVGKNIYGASRCIVDSLELEDGTKVHFAAGAMGACVYRIVRPQSYAEKVDAG